MKEIWVTQRKGQAIEHVLLPHMEYDAIRVIVEAARAYTEVHGIGAKRNAYRRLVKALGKEKLGSEQEYDNGPWASTGSDSCVDVAGYWHFPGPDVSVKTKKGKAPIRVVPLKQGYLVVPNVFEGYADDDLAFTDVVDLADWLLEWLGFDEDMYCLVTDPEDLLGCKYDLDWPDAYTRLLDVVGAAEAYVEAEGGVTVWAKLVEAVKKWRGTEGDKESAKTDTST